MWKIVQRLAVAAVVAGTFGLTALAPAASAGGTSYDLEQHNGGLDTTNEAPMFGDAGFEDAAGPMRIHDDPFFFDIPAELTAYSVAVAWGQLPPDRAPESYVWSGRFSLNRGTVVVRSTYGFEDVSERVAGRTRRDVVEFSSITRPFLDGIVLTVVDPSPELEATDPLTLTYDGGSGADTVTLAGLMSEPTTIAAGGDGKMVATAGWFEDDCGHLFGRLHSGSVYGVVADAAGEPIGHIRGIYGARENGKQVWFAKHIDHEGNFGGIFAGTYGNGEMQGRWLTDSAERTFEGFLIGDGFMLRRTDASC